VGGRVLHDVEEVTAQHGLATAQVDVEHTKSLQFVDHTEALGGAQLGGVTTPG
jgi:hypothetical protein